MNFLRGRKSLERRCFPKTLNASEGASDLSRILHCFGVGKQGNSTLYDYSRKLAYVGMSRPKKLLCVAMQAKTYEKAKKVFEHEWEIIDLRDGTEA